MDRRQFLSAPAAAFVLASAAELRALEEQTKDPGCSIALCSIDIHAEGLAGMSGDILEHVNRTLNQLHLSEGVKFYTVGGSFAFLGRDWATGEILPFKMSAFLYWDADGTVPGVSILPPLPPGIDVMIPRKLEVRPVNTKKGNLGGDRGPNIEISFVPGQAELTK